MTEPVITIEAYGKRFNSEVTSPNHMELNLMHNAKSKTLRGTEN